MRACVYVRVRVRVRVRVSQITAATHLMFVCVRASACMRAYAWVHESNVAAEHHRKQAITDPWSASVRTEPEALCPKPKALCPE